ncbi:MAG TPA: galactose-1-epimerase [Flavobacterium sp.]|nr:galactose-1-epimerase [Flavobacterium sp.]
MNTTEAAWYKITNKNGIEATILNYGATLTSLKIPLENGEIVDVVLGFSKFEEYVQSFEISGSPYFGAIVGRYAGRINNGSFILNGKKIQLNKNNGNNTLHGGFKNFSNSFWRLKTISNQENPFVTLEYCSPENEEHFPGQLTVEVTYTLTEENEIKVSYFASTSEDTIINLTQHSYFNLDGHDSDVLNQKLEVYSDKILETNLELIPTGSFIDLENHLFNYKKQKNCPASIDTTFVLNDEKAAQLISEKNKIKMTVITTQPAVHIYVGGSCSNIIKGKENSNYHKTSGICFETQNFPDAPNHNNFPNAVLKKGETYQHHTTFKFEKI